MARKNNNITTIAGDYVFELLKTKLPEKYAYHNYDRTREVVRACEEIGEGSKLSKPDLEIAILAAWFLHTGYVETEQSHEEKSAEIARNFLREKSYPKEFIDRVTGCILAAKVPQSPNNLVEEVVCDVENLPLGRKKYFDKNNLMRVEKESLAGKPYTDFEWLRLNIDSFNNNSFFTKYAQKQYNKRRSENLVRLQEELRDVIAESEKESSKFEVKKELLATKLEKMKKPERGVDTMFRVVSRNNMSLGMLADRKANVMIHTNAIVLSITISVLVRNMRETPHLLIPTIILIVVCLTTIVLAILSTRPRFIKSQNPEQKRANLLFFANYFGMDLEEYEADMREMMSHGDSLYGNLMRYTYYAGQILGRKFRYLTWCYNIFMYGLIVAVIAFAIALLMK